MKTLAQITLALALIGSSGTALADSLSFPQYDIAAFCQSTPTHPILDSKAECIKKYTGWRYASSLEWEKATVGDHARCVTKDEWDDYEAFYWCIAQNNHDSGWPREEDGTYLPMPALLAPR